MADRKKTRGPAGEKIHEEAAVVQTASWPLISWGALFAGLMLVLSAAWLLLVLGAAIGLGIVDASDAAAMNAGLATGTIIWMVISLLIAFFVGSFLTAAMAGSEEKKSGLLHGITLWSLGTVLMLLFGSWGIVNVVQTGASLVSSAVSTVGAAGSAAQSQGGPAVSWAGRNLAESQLVDRIGAMLKRQAAELVAEADSGTDSVSQAEARQAIEQLDADVLRQVSMNLISGNAQAAKDSLAIHTSLSEGDIESIVEGVRQKVEKQVQEFQQQAGQTLEAASSYSQAVLWGTFISMLLGLAAAIGGGILGAGYGRQGIALQKSRDTER